MKPCPCGYAGDTTRICTCSENEIHRYRSRLSGPLLDRIDLHVTLAPVSVRLLGSRTSETSSAVRTRVESSRARQRSRFRAANVRARCNGQASGRLLLPSLDYAARELLDAAAEAMTLSARAYHRVVKVGRTIADLAECESVGVEHIAEALRYRPVVSSAREAATVRS